MPRYHASIQKVLIYQNKLFALTLENPEHLIIINRINFFNKKNPFLVHGMSTSVHEPVSGLKIRVKSKLGSNILYLYTVIMRVHRN